MLNVKNISESSELKRNFPYKTLGKPAKKLHLCPRNYQAMKTSFVILGLVLFVSCQNASQDQPLENLDKKSAREVTLTTITKGDTVYHLTKQNIWVNGEQIVQKTDTIKTSLTEKTWSSSENPVKLNEIPIYVTVQ